jgi:hypothetical protein
MREYINFARAVPERRWKWSGGRLVQTRKFQRSRRKEPALGKATFHCGSLSSRDEGARTARELALRGAGGSGEGGVTGGDDK